MTMRPFVIKHTAAASSTDTSGEGVVFNSGRVAAEYSSSPYRASDPEVRFGTWASFDGMVSDLGPHRKVVFVKDAGEEVPAEQPKPKKVKEKAKLRAYIDYYGKALNDIANSNSAAYSMELAIKTLGSAPPNLQE